MTVVISAVKSIRQRQPSMIVQRFLRPILVRKSFLTQVGGAGVLAGSSDLLCQYFVEKNEKIDFVRVARFAGLVSCCMAPMAYKWYQYIERVIPAGGNKWKMGLKRVAADQIIAAPIFTSFFLFNLNVLETRNLKASLAKTANVFLPILTTNYKVWPIIQYVNLSIIPIQYRILLVQFIGLFWNMYISHMQHKES